jgi:ketosteroid isomerase-like protein
MVVILLLAACAPAERPGQPDPVQQVMNAERAFARTMAERDYGAFTTFLSAEAVFFTGGKVLRGRAAVAEGWKPYFEGTEPHFSWEPEQVEVLDSGRLALSSGPVYDPAGKRIATFNSIWRREARGVWRVVFDKGSPVCNEN